jgi:hypothetical protein
MLYLFFLLPIMSMPIIAIEKSVIFDMPRSAVLGKEIHVSDTAYTGSYTVIVLSYGADGVYGDTDKSNIIEAMNQKYNNPNFGSMSRNQILAVIHGASIDSPKSDDLINVQRLAVEAPKSYAVRLDDPIVSVAVGEPLTVTGTSDKKEGSEIIITVERPGDIE